MVVMVSRRPLLQHHRAETPLRIKHLPLKTHLEKCSRLEKSSKNLEKFYHFNTNMNRAAASKSLRISSNTTSVIPPTHKSVFYRFPSKLQPQRSVEG